MAKKTSITHKLYTGEISYDFYGHRKIWYCVSGAILTICVLAVAILHLQLGIEFLGGTEFTAEVKVTSSTIDDFRTAVQATGLPEMSEITVTTVGDNQVRVQTRALTTAEVTTVRQAIADKAGVSADDVSNSLIGSSWGAQITQQGIIALIVFLVLVMVLIWAYFRDFKMSIAAIVALMHDLIVTVGVYALTGFSVTPATLIGVLTILGYSLYDTVVVFDKVRENVADLFNGTSTYSVEANRAVNQVLVRSINTTIIGVLPVAALTFAGAFILGTGPLKDLGLALLVGMLAGTYSSIFIATPLLADMREAEPAMKDHRARIARRQARKAKKLAVEQAVAASAATTVEPVAAKASVLEAADSSEVVDVERLAVVSASQLRGRNQPTRLSRSQRKEGK